MLTFDHSISPLEVEGGGLPRFQEQSKLSRTTEWILILSVLVPAVKEKGGGQNKLNSQCLQECGNQLWLSIPGWLHTSGSFLLVFFQINAVLFLTCMWCSFVLSASLYTTVFVVISNSFIWIICDLCFSCQCIWLIRTLYL